MPMFPASLPREIARVSVFNYWLKHDSRLVATLRGLGESYPLVTGRQWSVLNGHADAASVIRNLSTKERRADLDGALDLVEETESYRDALVAAVEDAGLCPSKPVRPGDFWAHRLGHAAAAQLAKGLSPPLIFMLRAGGFMPSRRLEYTIDPDTDREAAGKRFRADLNVVFQEFAEAGWQRGRREPDYDRQVKVLFRRLRLGEPNDSIAGEELEESSVSRDIGQLASLIGILSQRRPE